MTPVAISPRLAVLLFVLACLAAPARADEPPCGSAEKCKQGVADVHEKAEAPEFDKLRTPDSPTFSVLGVAPSEVERPNSPRAVVLAIGAFVSDSGAELVVPDSLAIELNPYSILSGKPVKRADPDNPNHVSARNLWNNLTVSLATASEDVTDPTTMETRSMPTMVSLGARTRLYDASDRGMSCNNVRERMLDKVKATERNKTEFIRALSRDQQDDFYSELLNEEAELEALEQTCNELQGAANGGVSVDVAFATAGRYANSKLQWTGGHHHLATAGWLTAAYQFKYVSGVVLGRWRMEDTADEVDLLTYERRHYLDGGLRGIYARDRYGASIEAVLRWRVSGDPFADEDGVYSRFAVLADYEISNDHWLNVTFGKNFGGAPDESDIFTLANLKWSFDSDRSVAKKKDAGDRSSGASDEDTTTARPPTSPGTPPASSTPATPAPPSPAPPPPPPAPPT